MTSVNYVDWRIHPFRADRWLEIWEPALDRALAFGATICFLTRDVEDPLHFRQVSVWESREDFERYWFSDELGRPARGGAELLQQAACTALALADGRALTAER